MLKTTEGRWGNCTYFLKDEYVGRSIHYYGEYNPDETEKIISLASGICLDVGANIGVITQALLRTGFEVISFEPQPQVHEVLRTNCYHAGGKYTTFNTAVGSGPGIAKMPKVHYSEKGNFGGLGIGERSALGSYEVPIISLDSLNLTGVGFIKIDVEGHELEVLKGAEELIAECKPVMYIEDDRVEKSAALRAKIISMGYTIEEHQPVLYREANFKKLQKNVWPRLYASHNLICVPC